MPCGGIYPVKRVPGDCPSAEWDRCFYCLKAEPTADHFIEEWDAYIHGKCIEPFLETEEGKIVVGHGHEVIVCDAENGTTTVLHEETPG